MPDYQDIIDGAIFDQLLEMDDGDDHEFSRGIAVEYIKQGQTTLAEMSESLEQKDMASLGRLGHFMKGSSAAVGLKKLRATCEQIQNYGRKVDDKGNPLPLSTEHCLEKLQQLVSEAKRQFSEGEAWFKNFYSL
ncbi:hypothetical protein HDU84_008820 [Entophlyctis sp. JEL0112]|nr:hypothetical protein HDU84_008820 [Entophlyctis sp. JEL0112]